MSKYVTDFHIKMGIIGSRPSSLKKLIFAAVFMRLLGIRTVYDVGTGSGYALKIFRKFFIRGRGVEIYQDIVPFALIESGTIIVADAFKVPLSKLFNLNKKKPFALWLYNPFEGEKFRTFVKLNEDLFSGCEFFLFYNNPTELEQLPKGHRDRFQFNMLIRHYKPTENVTKEAG